MRDLFNSKFKITQEFGVNAAYYAKFGLKGHEGIDLIPTGSVWDVYCLEDGVVVKDDDIAGAPLADVYGIFVTVWHPSVKKASQYCHLKENFVQNGQQVKRGDRIGIMGSTGNTDGAHVHLNLFETDVNGARLNKNNGFVGGIDPLPFLMEVVTPPNTDALNECRAQVADEIKKKNETYQELQQVKAEWEAAKQEAKTNKDSLDKFLSSAASLLNIPVEQEKILGQIAKLIKEEDQLGQSQKKVQLIETELSQLRQDYGVADQKRKDAEIVNQQQALMLTENTTEIAKLKTDLSLAEQSTSLRIITKIFGVYIAVPKTKGGENS